MRGSNATTSRIAIFTIALFCLGVDAAEAQIDSSNFSAYVTLTTDYVFRGISQTNEGPAVQGGFDFHHDIGIFLGIWASNVEFPMDAAQYNQGKYDVVSGNYRQYPGVIAQTRSFRQCQIRFYPHDCFALLCGQSDDDGLLFSTGRSRPEADRRDAKKPRRGGAFR